LADQLHGRLSGQSSENGLSLAVSMPFYTSDQVKSAAESAPENTNGILKK